MMVKWGCSYEWDAGFDGPDGLGDSHVAECSAPAVALVHTLQYNPMMDAYVPEKMGACAGHFLDIVAHNVPEYIVETYETLEVQ